MYQTYLVEANRKGTHITPMHTTLSTHLQTHTRILMYSGAMKSDRVERTLKKGKIFCLSLNMRENRHFNVPVISKSVLNRTNYIISFLFRLHCYIIQQTILFSFSFHDFAIRIIIIIIHHDHHRRQRQYRSS